MPTYKVGVGETYQKLGELINASVLVDGDTIHVTDAGAIIETGSPLPTFTGLNNILLTTDPTNINTPVISLEGNDAVIFNNCTGIIVSKIKFIKSNTASGPGTGPRFEYCTNCVIDACEFDYPLVGVTTTEKFISISYSDGITVKNCKFKNIAGSAVHVADQDNNIYIVNNSFYGFNTTSASKTFIYIGMDINGLTCVNNIFQGDDGSGIALNFVYPIYGIVVQDYNCIHNVGTEYSGYAATAPHNIDSVNTPGATDPLFVDAPNDDFKLSAGSPCIDSGAGNGTYSQVPTIDYRDQARPVVIPGYVSVDDGTDIGAFEMLASELVSAINTFNQDTATPNEMVVSTINTSSLISKIQIAGTDTYFDTTSELGSVTVEYIHEDGRQKKKIHHSGSSLTGNVSWSATARDGTWQKTRIISLDKDGAKNTLLRINIGTGEDLTRSDGTMTLNT